MQSRRTFTQQLGVLAMSGAAGFHLSSQAQSHTVDLARLLVGFPPGGSTDNVARRLADKMRGHYAKNMIVENKPGAGMQIAVSALKSSAPDGTTLLLSPPSPFSISPFTYRTLPYTAEDVVPVAMVCTFPFAFAVGTAVPDSVKTLPDFIAWAKENPGKAHFGSPAAGSTPHLIGSLVGQLGRLELTHVAYRGDAPGFQDLMGGQVSGYSTTLGSFLPQLQSGRIRLLAVSGATRSPFAPDVPTYKEQGFDIDMTEWFGVYLPAKTPPALIQRTAEAVQKAVAHPEFAQGLAEFGMTARSSTPQEAAARLKADTASGQALVKRIGFTADS
jgi:tripartite-type tricarboxylate transporter receptor subunit TctC